MLLDYDPVVLGFIIDVNQIILQEVKDQLVIGIRALESDDRAYVYTPESHSILAYRGQIIGKISNFQRQKIVRLDRAVLQTLQIFSREDPDCEKSIFLVLDRFNHETDEYLLQKGFHKEKQLGLGCNFYVFDLKGFPALENLCRSHPHCYYEKTGSLDGLGLRMHKLYYPEQDRRRIDEDFKNKYGMTPQEAREELKKKYGNNLHEPPHPPTGDSTPEHIGGPNNSLPRDVRPSVPADEEHLVLHEDESVHNLPS